MKTTRLIWALAGHALTVASLLFNSGNSFAQTANDPTVVPVVSIRATDPLASWPGDPGAFTVYRAGNTNLTLNIYYRIAGTASNGVDYQTIGNFVQIPAGVTSNNIVIKPINSGQTDIRTVVLQLAPSPLMTPVNYEIGLPSSATVYITPPGVTNIPPFVFLTAPPDGSTYDAPANIGLVAVAGDPDGFVTSVEFFDNTQSLGVVSNWVVLDPAPPGSGYVPGARAFFLQWSNAPVGAYALTAKATDNGGATAVSTPVNITVGPHTNLPPVVRITSPPNNSLFRAPVDIPIYAYAHDPDGTIASVEFFDGTQSLGFGHPVPLPIEPVVPLSPVPPTFIIPTNYFVLIWSNAPTGTNVLTALATDNEGATTVSDPVTISVLPSLPPPTNRPVVISIVATDPVAIEGTNCWPWLGLVNVSPTWANWLTATPVCRFFTNCGPKNATFTVYRRGATNDDVTVAYAIGGTATNGLDYVALSGIVTISAGQRSAAINVVPLDDGPPDITSTVILKLLPDTNSPPDYVLGFPRSAAAIILDGTRPRPPSAVLPDRCFHLSAAGPDGAWFHVEYSTDLFSWNAICTNQVINGAIDFVDPDAPNDNSRYYRAVPEANPPSQ
jgi:hypothetical protein